MLNPDGRDRYVNWFTSVVGVQPNLDGLAAEHREPWPGGRSNHYYFNLNRDWVWMVQQETQTRLEQFYYWLGVTGYLAEKNMKLIENGVYLYHEQKGKGNIILFADDRNFRGFWQGLSQLFFNAAFLFASPE